MSAESAYRPPLAMRTIELLTQELSPSARARLDESAGWVERALDGYATWVAAERWESRPGSPADFERGRMRRQFGPGGSWTDADAESLRGLCATLLAVAAQHLIGAATLLRSGNALIPLAPVGRSVLEIVGLLSWVLHTQEEYLDQASVRDRSAKIALVALHDLNRAKVAYSAFGHPAAPRVGAVWSRQKRELRERFYPSEVSYAGNGELILRGFRRPGLRAAMSSFEQVHGVEWNLGAMYDYLSNASHPTPHHAVSLTVESETGVRLNLDDPDLPCDLSRAMLVAFGHTCGLVAEYFGHDDPDLGIASL